VVPASARALLFTPAWDAATSQRNVDGLQLIGPDGAPVAVKLEEVSPSGGSYLVVPQTALEPGKSYRLRYPQGCLQAHPTSPSIAEHAFQTSPVEKVPSQLGSASMTGHRLAKMSVWTISGSCTSEITAALAHVTVRPSPELAAYLAMAHVSGFVNGQDAPIVNYRVADDRSIVELDVYAGCVVADRGAFRGLLPGKHRLELRAHVVGEAVDPPPIWTDIQLDCAGNVGAGPTEPGSATGPSGSADAGAGCSFTPGRGAGGWLASLAMVILAASRRRRAR
jgi:MYXO-CTERM domain-containing protein